LARAAVESRRRNCSPSHPVWLLAMPGVAVFALLAFLLYAAGHRPERRRHFAAE